MTRVSALVGEIRAYIDHWNTAPHRFTWTAAGDQILAKVRLVQTNVRKPVDNKAP